MRQLTLTLSPQIDENALLKVLKNLNGVENIKISDPEKNEKTSSERVEEIINNLKQVRDSIDKSLIDFNDEKTKYILSK